MVAIIAREWCGRDRSFPLAGSALQRARSRDARKNKRKRSEISVKRAEISAELIEIKVSAYK